MTFYIDNVTFHKDFFLTFSSLEDCQRFEKSQEVTDKYLCQVSFTTNRPLTAEQEKISGKPCNLHRDIVRSRKMISTCDSVGHTYLDLYPLASHNESEKKIDECNASHSYTRNER